MHNAAMLDIVNNGPDTIIFKPEEMIGILDLRSLGYYKIKQGILQQNLSKYSILKAPQKGERTERIERKLSMVRSQ